MHDHEGRFTIILYYARDRDAMHMHGAYTRLTANLLCKSSLLGQPAA